MICCMHSGAVHYACIVRPMYVHKSVNVQGGVLTYVHFSTVSLKCYFFVINFNTSDAQSRRRDILTDSITISFQMF